MSPLHPRTLRIACSLVALASVLTACTKIEAPEPLPEGCSFELVRITFTREESGVEFTVENLDSTTVTALVSARYFDGSVLVGEGEAKLNGILGEERARITVRPKVALGPRGFDCVTWTLASTTPNGRNVRSCYKFERETCN